MSAQDFMFEPQVLDMHARHLERQRIASAHDLQAGRGRLIAQKVGHGFLHTLADRQRIFVPLPAVDADDAIAGFDAAALRRPAFVHARDMQRVVLVDLHFETEPVETARLALRPEGHAVGGDLVVRRLADAQLQVDQVRGKLRAGFDPVLRKMHIQG